MWNHLVQFKTYIKWKKIVVFNIYIWKGNVAAHFTTPSQIEHIDRPAILA